MNVIKLVFNSTDRKYHLALVDPDDNDLVIQDFGSLEPNKLDRQEDYEILNDIFYLP